MSGRSVVDMWPKTLYNVGRLGGAMAPWPPPGSAHEMYLKACARMNTQRLCNDLIDDNEHEFIKECTVDDTILLDMSVYEGLSVPEMTLENLKFILFKKLKPNTGLIV